MGNTARSTPPSCRPRAPDTTAATGRGVSGVGRVPVHSAVGCASGRCGLHRREEDADGFGVDRPARGGMGLAEPFPQGRDGVAPVGRTRRRAPGFADLGELVEFVHRRDCANAADRVLYRLVCRGLTDDLAARTVLACMMPGAKNLTCGYLWAHDNADEAAAAVLAAMWERIRTYPCERRPVKVAANIQLDTSQRMSRRAARAAKDKAGCEASAVLAVGIGSGVRVGGCNGELLGWSRGGEQPPRDPAAVGVLCDDAGHVPDRTVHARVRTMGDTRRDGTPRRRASLLRCGVVPAAGDDGADPTEAHQGDRGHSGCGVAGADRGWRPRSGRSTAFVPAVRRAQRRAPPVTDRRCPAASVVAGGETPHRRSRPRRCGGQPGDERGVIHRDGAGRVPRPVRRVPAATPSRTWHPTSERTPGAGPPRRRTKSWTSGRRATGTRGPRLTTHPPTWAELQVPRWKRRLTAVECPIDVAVLIDRV